MKKRLSIGLLALAAAGLFALTAESQPPEGGGRDKGRGGQRVPAVKAVPVDSSWAACFRHSLASS